MINTTRNSWDDIYDFNHGIHYNYYKTDLSGKLRIGLEKVWRRVIEEEKKNNGYQKIPAKDL